MKNNDSDLTSLELQLLNAARAGMDRPNSGWLHEISPISGKTLSGVVSSLVQKGVIRSEDHDGCYWVEVEVDWWTQEDLDEENDWRESVGMQLLHRSR